MSRVVLKLFAGQGTRRTDWLTLGSIKIQPSRTTTYHGWQSYKVSRSSRSYRI